MDESATSYELMESYHTWILGQRIQDYQLEPEDDGSIRIENEAVSGGVGFYDIDGTTIVELRLERKENNEPVFFLHFELNDLTRAKKLFLEMVDTLDEAAHPRIRHILLCCSCGMTTTFFAMKLNECATTLGVSYDFTAKSIVEAKRDGASYAAVLLAPQVGYQRKEVVETLPKTPVIEIPGKIFGTYDAPRALQLVVDALSGSHSAAGTHHFELKRPLDDSLCLLTISYINREDEPTLAYRVFDHGKVTISDMVVRRRPTIQSFEDLAATLAVRGYKTTDFDAIGIAVPNRIENGMLIEVLKDGSELAFDIVSTLERHWETTVFIDRTATAAATGCYISQDVYESVAFHAQAIGNPVGDEGYVVNGEPFCGHNGHSGLLAPIVAGFDLNMDLNDVAWRVNGVRQLVAHYVTTLACTIAPEAVYVWCDLLPEMDDLREELSHMLPESAIPALYDIADYDSHVLMGEMALCMLHLSR